MKNKTVAVALSGGVDSGASAYILQKQGLSVFGITMKTYDDFDVDSPKYVADKLGIKHYVMDYRKYFEEEIINKFIEEYLEGKTPNPCIRCNMNLKYGLLFNDAKKLGADYFATGHYARVKFSHEDGLYHLYKSSVERKDQSYFLYHLKQEQLSSVIFPLEKFENKNEVRNLVKDIMPLTSEKKDSQNICFIQNMSHTQYIKNKCAYFNQTGNFVNINGEILGKHEGVFNYTIGQKRGLNLGKNLNLTVLDINKKTNEITLGEDRLVYKNEIKVSDITYTNDNYYKINNFHCNVKICQWGYFLDAVVYNEGYYATVKFVKPERAPAPGQSAVFYKGDEIFGGGIIM